jgi:hypothetical protein
MTIRKALEPGKFNVIKKQDDDSYTFVISSEEPDLIGDVVVQAGMKPVSERIPAQVDHSGQVKDLIGSWRNIRQQGKTTLADLSLFEKGISNTADLVRALLDAGVQMAASIGFTGRGQPIAENKRGYMYPETKLIEASVVSVPCHPAALSVAKSLDLSQEEIEQFFVEDRTEYEARKKAALDRVKAILG